MRRTTIRRMRDGRKNSAQAGRVIRFQQDSEYFTKEFEHKLFLQAFGEAEVQTVPVSVG